MRVLVAGGAGYIGSVVTAALLAERPRGDRARRPLDRPRRRRALGRHAGARSSLHDSAPVLADVRPEAVLHFAAKSLVGASQQQPEDYWHTNVGGSLALLEAMRAADCRRIVFSSTAATYGEPESVPIREDAPTRPTNTYGAIEARRRPHAHLVRGRARVRRGEPALLQRRRRRLRPRRAARHRDPPHPDRAAGRRRAAGVDHRLRRGLPDPRRHLHPRLRARRRPRRRAPARAAGARPRASTGSTTWATAPASRCRRSSTPSAR